MPQKPPRPTDAGRQVLRKGQAYFAEPNAIRRDEIASRQLQALRQYPPRYWKKLRITNVIEMFQEMRDQV